MFGSGAVHAAPVIGGLLVAMALLSAGGCSWGQSKKDPADGRYAQQGPGVFGEASGSQDQYDQDGELVIPDAEASESTRWSIVLAVLTNPDQAFQTLSVVKSTHGLVGAYLDQRGDNDVIAYGSYSGPDDTRAKLDLDRIRSMQSGTSRPFAGAYLAPPPAQALSGANAEYDLRTVQDRFGAGAIYTLQLGVYGKSDNTNPSPSEIKEFRQAAEQAVLELRAQGERAFYYHAPFRSMVTVGVFGEADFDATTTPPMESMSLRELRKKYPYNYLNGQGISETIMTDTGQRVTRLQSSSLVAIPKK